jgi:hypothetical protein
VAIANSHLYASYMLNIRGIKFHLSSIFIFGLLVSFLPSAQAATAPTQQKRFIEIMVKGKKAYEDAKTDLKSSVALRNRDKAACGVLNNLNATNWVGKITDIGANGEGKAYIQIEIASGVRVQTWSNSFSDMNDNTLIPEDSKVFNAIMDGDEGSPITFSAKFIKGTKTCIKGTNFTDYFYATDPKFVVKITAAKLGK